MIWFNLPIWRNVLSLAHTLGIWRTRMGFTNPPPDQSISRGFSGLRLRKEMQILPLSPKTLSCSVSPNGDLKELVVGKILVRVSKCSLEEILGE